GTVAELTARPATRYVAELAGTNLLPGEAQGTEVVVDGVAVRVADAAHGPVNLTIRPSSITLHPDRPTSSARNCWALTVASVDLLGERVRVGLDGTPPLVAEITAPSFAALGLGLGDRVWATVKATDVAA